MKFISKEGCLTILNSTQQLGHIFTMLLRPRDFIQMASDRPFNNHRHIILSQTCPKLQNESIGDSEVDNCLEKIDFADLVKDTESVACFSPFRQFQGRLNDVT